MDPTPNPPLRQLSLPLDVPDDAISSPPPLAEVVIRPRLVWHRLTPDLQARMRQALVRICREVLDDPA